MFSLGFFNSLPLWRLFPYESTFSRLLELPSSPGFPSIFGRIWDLTEGRKTRNHVQGNSGDTCKARMQGKAKASECKGNK